MKEFDLRPLREEALRPVQIVLTGQDAAAVQRLAQAIRRDPDQPQASLDSPLQLLTLEAARQARQVDLLVLLTSIESGEEAPERELARQWTDEGRNLLVVVLPAAAGASGQLAAPGWQNWKQRRVVHGVPDSLDFLRLTFIPAMLALLPGRTLALARHYPLFRATVARDLIQDTCFSNTAYAISTGLAEIVPVLDVPLNVADMVVLSKSQAFLVYKLGLALGMSTRWQDYVAEFGSVLGSGFVWRQVARMVVGLIPAWGILPKAAVAYSGTYVVGQVVLHWYLTGRHVSREQMRQLYSQASLRGRDLAAELVRRMPRPKKKLTWPKLSRPKISLPRLPWRKQPAASTPQLEAGPAELAAEQAARACPRCGRESAGDARFCQYCGQDFEQPLSQPDR